jgi:hypothetical protein
MSFSGVNPKDPDGPPVEFQFAEGKWWTSHCVTCGWDNGGFIETEKHTRENAEKDEYCPVNRPCLRCRKSPVVWKAL